MTIAPVSTAPTTTASSGASAGADGTDPASGDLFAMLVAALLPHATVDPTAAATAPAAGATTTDGTAVSATGGVGGAGAAGTGVAATAVDIDAAAAAAIAAGTAAPEGATPSLTATPDTAPVDAVTAATIASASATATPVASTVATPQAPQAKAATPKGGRDMSQSDVHSGEDVDITDHAHPGNGVDPSIRLQRHGAGIDDHGASPDHDADSKQDPAGKGWADAPGRAVSALATSAPGAEAATHRHVDSDSDTPVATEPAAAATPSVSATRSVTTTPTKDKADVDADDLHVAGASPVGVANRAAPLERPAVAAPVAPSTRSAEVPAHEQITTAVSTLRQHGDGSYHVSVHLHPADLGPVDLDVQLHHDSIELHMHAEHEHARELLHDHIGDIRHELEQLGLQATTVDVGDGSRRRQSPAFTTTTPSFATPVADDVPVAVAPAAATLPPTGDAALDVRI